MSRFQRQGTVSGPAGHTHFNSYAMKGVRLRYKPSIYVPDLLQLPPNWTKPTLPSEQAFNYDYSLENRIANQAKHRALSIASEASLQRRQIVALQHQQLQQQQQDAGDGLSGIPSATSQSSPPGRKHSAPIHPFMSGTEILTPTLVAPAPSSSNASNVALTNAEKGEVSGEGTGVNAPGAGSQSNSDGSSSSLLSDEDGKKVSGTNDKERKSAAVKSLGFLSLKEFEGDSTDPFEMASLLAINDMEELQSVLQPLLGTGPSTGYSNNAPPTSNNTLTSSNSSLPGPPVSSAMFTIAAPSPPMAVVSPLGSNFAVPALSVAGVATNTDVHFTSASASASHSSVFSKSSTDLTIAVVQPLQLGENRHSESAISSSPAGQIQRQPFHQNTQQAIVSSGNSFVAKGSPTLTSSRVSLPGTNPGGSNILSNKQSAEDSQAVSYPYIPLSTENHELPQQDQHHQTVPPQQVRDQPAIATLVDVGGSGSKTPPVPAPRSSPKLVNKDSPSQTRATSAASSSSSPLPVPRPRPRGGSPSPTGTPHSSSGAIKVLPPPPSPRTSPSVARRSHVVPITSQTTATGNVNPPTKNWLTGHGGVAVLPPLPSQGPSSSSQPEDLPPPPAYKAISTPPTSRKVSPPPPYSSPVTNHRTHPVAPALPTYRPPPRVAPKPYSLPNPGKLSAAESEQVKTIEGIGFPQPRVARAVLRFKGDQTKVLDFLFLVGELEDARFDGDSAEAALISCEESIDKAKEYLQKLETYKEFGFHEKAIHEAYTKAKADWDEALNILTKDR